MNVVSLSKVSILFFVGSVTFWYMVTPYIVQPHPGIMEDVLAKTQLTDLEVGSSSQNPLITIENWTKWRMFFNSSLNNAHPPQEIFGNSRKEVSLSPSNAAVMNLEYMPEYVIKLTPAKLNPATIEVQREAPESCAADWGIYNHFTASVAQSDPRRVQVVPRFLFGIPFDRIEQMYGTDVSKFPIVGVFTNSPRSDRFIIQIYMNLVTLSVIFLLYANNPPQAIRAGMTRKVD